MNDRIELSREMGVKFGSELEYGYKMPFFPLIPVLGIITQLFLALYMFNYSPTGWYSIIIWTAIGFMVYFGYSVNKEKIEKGKIARQVAPGDYRVVVALYIIGVPKQTFLEAGDQFIWNSEPIFKKAVSTRAEFGTCVIG